jgi:DNA (cytosine-5)-methyltransferase 1
VSKLIALDCYCGAGGLSLGLKRAGFDVAWAFDAAALPVSTYNHNLGNHAEQLNSEDVSPDEVLKRVGLEVGECALVAGGPPCQGFSRQRRGSDIDPRNDEIMRFFSLVAAVRPRFFLLENVPALRGPRGKPYLAMLTTAAAREGYLLHTQILNSADFGVPQLRRRLFIVGELTSGLAHFQFPHSAFMPDYYKTVRQAIGDLREPGESGDRLLANHEVGNISDLNRLRISHVPPGGGREHIPDELKLNCHKVSVEVAGHRNVYGRLAWDKPANTITTKCNSFTRGMFAHPSANRNITMREAARLQGFPDDFVFLGSRVDVAHQIGNAVPPPVGEALGKALAQAFVLSAKRSVELKP